MQHSAARASALSNLMTPLRDATCTRRRWGPLAHGARTCCRSAWLLARLSAWPSSAVIAQREKRLEEEQARHRCTAYAAASGGGGSMAESRTGAAQPAHTRSHHEMLTKTHALSATQARKGTGRTDKSHHGRADLAHTRRSRMPDVLEGRWRTWLVVPLLTLWCW
jgi:hypothetical protein